MSVFQLTCRLLTECPLEETFEVFKNPYNLAKITPPWLNFRVVTADVQMREGAEIDYNIKWLGLPMHWKTLITAYEPPYFFVDEQAQGPYSLWRHHHTFATTSSGTEVGDKVEYELPLGPLGDIAHALMVKKQLAAIFKYRQRELGKLLRGKTLEAAAPKIERLSA